MSMWPGFALWTAVAWERTPRKMRIAGAATIGAIGLLLILAASAWPQLVENAHQNWGTSADRSTAWRALNDIPTSAWLAFRPYIAMVGVALSLGAGTAIYLVVFDRQKLARVALALSMIPTGLLMIEGTATMAPYFSLAEAARFLNQPSHRKGEVLYEGPLHLGSSLVFYLNRRFFLVNQSAENEFALNGDAKPWHGRFVGESVVIAKWREAESVYLLVEHNRLPYWQNLLTDRFHIYHQVATCGTYVVLSNQL